MNNFYSNDDYLMHYGVKGMKWKNKKGHYDPSDISSNLARVQRNFKSGKADPSETSSQLKSLKEQLEAYAKQQTTPNKKSLNQKRQLKAQLEAYVKQQTKPSTPVSTSKPATTTSNDPSDISANLAKVQSNFKSGKTDPSEASSQLKALKEQLEAYARQQTSMKHWDFYDNYLMHYGVKGMKWKNRKQKNLLGPATNAYALQQTGYGKKGTNQAASVKKASKKQRLLTIKKKAKAALKKYASYFKKMHKEMQKVRKKSAKGINKARAAMMKIHDGK